MKYILKYYLYSKYYEHKRPQYVELPKKEDIIYLIHELELERGDYEIFIKVI